MVKCKQSEHVPILLTRHPGSFCDRASLSPFLRYLAIFRLSLSLPCRVALLFRKCQGPPARQLDIPATATRLCWGLNASRRNSPSAIRCARRALSSQPLLLRFAPSPLPSTFRAFPSSNHLLLGSFAFGPGALATDPPAALTLLENARPSITTLIRRRRFPSLPTLQRHQLSAPPCPNVRVCILCYGD